MSERRVVLSSAEYHVVTDRYSGYEAQYRTGWWPFWRIITSGNSSPTIDEAVRDARRHAHREAMSSRCWAGSRFSYERAAHLALSRYRGRGRPRHYRLHGMGVHATRAATGVPAQDMSRWQRVELECDRQVAILMSTKDLVELERAQFLIRLFDCAVGRRLPRP